MYSQILKIATLTQSQKVPGTHYGKKVWCIALSIKDARLLKAAGIEDGNGDQLVRLAETLAEATPQHRLMGVQANFLNDASEMTVINTMNCKNKRSLIIPFFLLFSDIWGKACKLFQREDLAPLKDTETPSGKKFLDFNFWKNITGVS